MQSRDTKRTYAGVKEKERLASPAPRSAWTRPEDYLGAMARKRNFRRAHRERLRTQPERPRLLLSTVPFLVVIGLLAVLAAGIMIIAFPGSQPLLKQRQVEPRETGTAQRGWFEEAQKEFHH